jgi:hypothetical protein
MLHNKEIPNNIKERRLSNPIDEYLSYLNFSLSQFKEDQEISKIIEKYAPQEKEEDIRKSELLEAKLLSYWGRRQLFKNISANKNTPSGIKLVTHSDISKVLFDYKI